MGDKMAKVTAESMNSEFSGQPRVGQTESGTEDFPAEKWSVVATKSSASEKGPDFKGEGQNKDC